MDHLDEHLRAVLDGLTTHARPLILGRYRADSCIAATRVAIETLNYFGIAAQPIPLLVMVFNPEAAEMLNNGTSIEDVSAATFARSPKDEGGPWTIVLGTGQQQRSMSDPGWAGHLVAGVQEHQVVVDLSIDQISRPLKNMTFEPMWATIPDQEWWNGNQPHAGFNTKEGTFLVLDRNAVDPEGFKTSENWTMKGDSKTAVKHIVGQTVRLIRSDLAEAGIST